MTAFPTEEKNFVYWVDDASDIFDRVEFFEVLTDDRVVDLENESNGERIAGGNVLHDEGVGGSENSIPLRGDAWRGHSRGRVMLR